MKIVFRPQFWADLEDGVAYLHRQASADVANRWHSEVVNVVSQVASLPDIGRPRPDLAPPGIRSLVLRRYPRYLLFYLWREDTVELLRVKHGMMDLSRLFSEDRSPAS